MVEFKQIVGRGTRIYEGKYFFTIYDFEGASNHYKDPEWDGDAIEVEDDTVTPKGETGGGGGGGNKKEELIQIKLSDGYERNILMKDEVVYNAHNKPVTLDEFIETLFDESIPDLFENEAKLQQIWSLPQT